MAGHIVAVLGGKGGVGKSVFAANLAIAYLQETKQRPLYIVRGRVGFDNE